MKTHCKRGHPRTPENLYNEGACKICSVELNRIRDSERLGRPILTKEEYKAVQKANRKTHCINGHLRTPENLRPNGRSCKVCHQEQGLRRYHANFIPKPKKTHCRNGHPKTSDNLNSQGACKACERVADKRKALKDSEASKARKLEKNKVWIDSSTGQYVSQSRRGDLQEAGWTQQMVEITSEEQGHRCAICRKPSENKGHQMSPGGLVADHKHSKPPEPRALLCGHCNSLIGFAKDSPEICRAAAEYLESWV